MSDPDVRAARAKLQTFCRLYNADMIMLLQILIAAERIKDKDQQGV
jgi:hypothetical protein